MSKRPRQFLKPYKSLGEAEAQAAAAVVRSGTISGFFGSPGPGYLGGPLVKKFEQAWSTRFKVRYVVSVNSATSGLMAALGAVGVKSGDEVIVPPLSMSATVVAPLMYGGVPVFVDVEEETGCLSVAAVARAITRETKAILAVNLFGHPARLKELRALADEKGIFLVEDNAQGLLATEDGRYCGTIGHIGVFSLNYHKHIHTGEGGMCVTTNGKLARRLQLIRNHGENAVATYKVGDPTLFGHNWRLTEVQAAIGLVQLKKMNWRVRHVQRAAQRLSQQLQGVQGLMVPIVREGCVSASYVWMARLDRRMLRGRRAAISRSLARAGVPHMAGYVKPLYKLPLFAPRHFPADLCPVAERLTGQEWLGLEMCRYDYTDAAVDKIANVIRKVFVKYVS